MRLSTKNGILYFNCTMFLISDNIVMPASSIDEVLSQLELIISETRLPTTEGDISRPCIIKLLPALSRV
jgi:hypothetical protein